MEVIKITVVTMIFGLVLFFIPLGELINSFYPCIQVYGNSFPCHFIYDVYKMVLAAVLFWGGTFLLLYIFLSRKIKSIYRKAIVLKNKEDIKKMFFRALEENKSGLIKTALNGKPLVYGLGETFADEYMELRKSKNIFLQSLRFTTDNVNTKKHSNYSVYNKETRIAPSGMKINESMIMWNDCVAIVNTNTWTGRIIQQPNHSKKINKWFDDIWSKSKTV